MHPVRRAPFGESPIVGERGANTQRRILQAALEVFGTHGFHNARVELITEASGCSRPAFYQYFSGKDDVFWHLAGELTAALDELSEQRGEITADAAGVEQLRRWFDAVVDLHAAYEPVFGAYPLAVRDRVRIAQQARKASARLGAGLIPSATNGGSAASRRPARSTDALASVTATVVLRTIHYWRAGLGQLSRARFVAATAQTLHRLHHGPIDGVNVGKVARPPSKRIPPWPEPPASEEPLRNAGRQTRERLLAAGTIVLPKRGYHASRVDDIVEQAGVSHGTFYRYFESKDDLFQVLARRAAGAMVELVTTYPADASADGLQAWLRDWFFTYEENGGVISTWQEINFEGAELAAFSLDIAATVFDRLSRIVHLRGFGDSTVDALALLAVIERVPYSSKVLGQVDQEDAVRAASVFIRRGLLGLVDA